MKAELIIPMSDTLEDLQVYIAECASVVRDKDPKSPAKLWDRLLVESYGDTASRLFEYIPCTLHLDPIAVQKQYFGFWTDLNVYHTNMRELLNWGWTVEDCLDCVDFTHYRAVKCEAPYFIYGQVSTHNQITSVSHSQRYGTCDRGYWMPPECKEFTINGWTDQVLWTPPEELKTLMKEFGIVRKEVWDRGADMLQNRVFTLGGYTSNPNAWPHFIEQRLDSHTQLETREFTALIESAIS